MKKPFKPQEITPEEEAEIQRGLAADPDAREVPSEVIARTRPVDWPRSPPGGKIKFDMNTPEEDAAINAGIAADPDTLEITDEVFSKMTRGRPGRSDKEPGASF